jgi:hypothetical protein
VKGGRILNEACELVSKSKGGSNENVLLGLSD